MNSKLIAIIAVVAMCGAALVGVGYAYSATLDNSGNTITSEAEYTTLSLGDNATKAFSFTGIDIEYSTVCNSDGSVSSYRPANEVNTYDAVATTTLKITNVNTASTYNKVSLEVTLPNIKTYNNNESSLLTGVNDISKIEISIKSATISSATVNPDISGFKYTYTLDKAQEITVALSFSVTVTCDTSKTVDSPTEINLSDLIVNFKATPVTVA